MRGHWHRVVIAVGCVACIGSSAASLRGRAEVPEAPAGAALAAGEAVEETLELPAGHYFEIEVEQIQGDVAVELIGPDGGVVAASDLPGKPWISEVAAGITRVAGAHRLRIEASTESIAVEMRRVTRVAGRGDTALVAALAARAEAQRRKELETERDLGEAIALFEVAVADFLAAGDAVWSGRVLRELGRCQQKLGALGEAEENYRESISLLRRGSDTSQLAESLNYYGVLLLERGDRVDAEELFEEGLELAARWGDARIEALSWNNLGVLYYYEGDMERVVESFERSLAVADREGRIEGRANTLTNLGAAYRALGRYSDALELAEDALALARRLGDIGQEMRVLNNRGVLLRGVGDLRAAIGDYEESLELATRLGDRRWQASIGSNLGAIYRLMGHRKRALEYLSQALHAAVEAESVSEQIWASLTIGELLREAGDAEAESFYRRAHESSRASGDLGGEAYSLYGLGRARLDSGRAADSAELLGQALELLEATSDRPGQLSVHRELARALAVLGQDDLAGDHFSRAVAIARLVGDPYQEAAARARLAQFLLESGELEAAKEEVSLALATIESLRRGVVEPDLRAGFLSRSQQDFTLLVDVLEELDRRFPRAGYDQQAFAVAERARARGLVELLTESESELMRDLPRPLQRRRSDLAGRLSHAQKSLTRALNRENLDSGDTERLRGDVHRLNLERTALEREIRLSDPRWSRLVYPKPVELEGAQALLGSGEVLVSFVLGERASFVFAITSTDIALERIAPEGELRPLIESVRAGIERPGRRTLGRYKVMAAQLFEELIAPVRYVLDDQSHLLISPDGLLHYLPFEALVMPSDGDSPGPYLLSRWAVSYLPSASTLEVLEGRESRPAQGALQFAAFADPELPNSTEEAMSGRVATALADRESWRWRRLAGARSEVESIAGLFDEGSVELFVGEDASERSFRTKRSVREARYVHLASHAIIDSSEPALSALLLSAGEADDDGLLQAHEIFELDLEADLVVLSGCETALGRDIRGEGLLGMTRAFLYAGADAVAVSLWAVEDLSTSELMVEFYGELSRGGGAAQALRQAKLSQIAQSPHSHPFYWAPFVLVGSPS